MSTATQRNSKNQTASFRGPRPQKLLNGYRVFDVSRQRAFTSVQRRRADCTHLRADTLFAAIRSAQRLATLRRRPRSHPRLDISSRQKSYLDSSAAPIRGCGSKALVTHTPPKLGVPKVQKCERLWFSLQMQRHGELDGSYHSNSERQSAV